VLWSYPGEGGGMCAESSVGSETRVWCGTGWTSQPSVFDRDGRTWVVFDAYDRHIHFVDYETGQDILPPFPTGDIIKGSVSIDGEGLLGDVMYVGGEKSQVHVVKLNRSTGADGLVQVAPELVFNTPGWDDELIAALTTRQEDVSIENSVAYHEGIVYFANSLLPRSFSTPTCRNPSSSTTIEASMSSLDPRQPDSPLVWSLKDPGGFWATPALHKDVVIAPSDGGTVYAVDRQTGAVRWQFELPPTTWQSPVIVDDVLIQGDYSGVLHGYDVSDTSVAPFELWSVQLEGCIESTPAVWNGRLFVGARGGRFYAIGDPG
jgi:outer membrane protein assembly factor BamB